jgi:hypothetical protein
VRCPYCGKLVHNTEAEAHQYQLLHYLRYTNIDIIEAESLYRVYQCGNYWHISTKGTRDDRRIYI